MKKLVILWITGMLCFSSLSQAADQPSAVQVSDRDDLVIERLVSMGKYLRSLKTFAIHADTTNDKAIYNGQKLQFSGTTDYLVQVPEHMHLELKSDGRSRIYTYDGKTLTQYSPLLGYYASMDITGTIGQLIIQVKEKYNLDMPLADLFLWGTDKAGTKDIQSAIFVGYAEMNGHETEHFAFRQEGVDWQIWIQSGDQPLPDKLVVTDTSDPIQPNFVSNLKWDLSPKLQAKDFTFTPPKGAVKIDIVTIAPTAKQ